MKSLRELCYLGRDFVRYARGRDYFRQPASLGLHFQDARCYYNDLRGKTRWQGKCIDGLPAYYYPQDSEYVLVPITVLQYGIGSLDCFFTTGKEAYLDNVRNVARWLLGNILSEGHYNNRLTDRDSGNEYYSHNSSMVQGELLSFGVRAVQHGLLDAAMSRAFEALMKRVFSNMILPIDQNGTALYDGEEVYFCEFCRTDRCVVLNGWIYTYFGLQDYARFGGDVRAEPIRRLTLQTMQKALPLFQRADGWAYYDNKGRICSPFYQDLHIALMDAMFRLSGARVFSENMSSSVIANSRLNRIRYTISKIACKLVEEQSYGTQA